MKKLFIGILMVMVMFIGMVGVKNVDGYDTNRFKNVQERNQWMKCMNKKCNPNWSNCQEDCVQNTPSGEYQEPCIDKCKMNMKNCTENCYRLHSSGRSSSTSSSSDSSSSYNNNSYITDPYQNPYGDPYTFTPKHESHYGVYPKKMTKRQEAKQREITNRESRYKAIRDSQRREAWKARGGYKQHCFISTIK